MKLSSPQTYKVVRFALEARRFKQLEAQKATGVSFGLVNRVTQWMVSRKFVGEEAGGYRVIAPAALAQTFSVFRRMEDLRSGAYTLNVDAIALNSLLKKHGAVFCLSSALPYYDDYFKDPVVQVYGSDLLKKALFKLPAGRRTRVEVYEDDLQDRDDIVSEKGVNRTTKMRTIVDLLCSERAYAADQLIKKTWG